ncbi:MAG: IPTL-CTERM sorting domain-containing protein, partial [Comamonadaceae bacterium]|nr:IPTL-CTERM sorting domain-containing protein [Comamonadaceae bacterium]
GKFTLSGVQGGASGQPLSYSSATPAVCTVDANSGEVTMLAAGECVIEVKQPGNASYEAASTHRLSIMLSTAAVLSSTPVPVPVMGPWGLMLLALAAAALGALRLRRD